MLEGDVVMSELPDRRATGDRAEIDQAANTVLLTGPVVVTQGNNELKGRRLFFNRTTAQNDPDRRPAPATGGSAPASAQAERHP